MGIIQNTISIGCGQGGSFGLSVENHLLVNGFDNQNQPTTIDLGKRSQKDIDSICEYLQRLKIHL